MQARHLISFKISLNHWQPLWYYQIFWAKIINCSSAWFATCTSLYSYCLQIANACGVSNRTSLWVSYTRTENASDRDGVWWREQIGPVPSGKCSNNCENGQWAIFAFIFTAKWWPMARCWLANWRWNLRIYHWQSLHKGVWLVFFRFLNIRRLLRLLLKELLFFVKILCFLPQNTIFTRSRENCVSFCCTHSF